MTKNTRRFTYLSFFLLFFIIAPILVFYGLGYRYNFAKKIIEKNGAVFVKSYPSKATITIDQKIDKEKTPIQITEIKPGLHQITLSKDGYLPWTKNLAVKAGEATFIEDVALFLEDRTKMDLGVGGTNYLINKNKNKYLYLNNNDLFITNTEQEKTTKIFTFDIKTELIDWSPDDQKILFLQDKQYSILEIGSNKIKKLNLKYSRFWLNW
ncbi:MAG: PEGA domain protein [Parcubacteria group bacterium GW2011_GWA2_36_10]|nr:MAG: PEGA domain protein [Parcubacteria group bacterium GW2011_GWA2_36_10]